MPEVGNATGGDGGWLRGGRAAPLRQYLMLPAYSRQSRAVGSVAMDIPDSELSWYPLSSVVQGGGKVEREAAGGRLAAPLRKDFVCYASSGQSRGLVVSLEDIPGNKPA